MVVTIILITLAVMLVTKELASASHLEFAQRLATFLTVPIVSLLILFVLVIALSVAEILP